MTITSDSPHIEILAGFDGANPQRQDDIIMESPRRFRIRPFNEPGSNDHYWFAFTTLIVNHGEAAQDVELILEWPALENHPDHPYDEYYCGDMGNWQRLDATIDGTEAHLVVPAAPGRTFVGLFPRYSYGWYIQFLASLPENDPRIERCVLGASTHGRDISSLRITDPSVSDEGKATLLVTARSHPYETSCSYLVEDMIRHLLTGDEGVSAMLQRNVICILPITNPDGVVMGLNQRTGLDGVNISYGVDTGSPEVDALLGLVETIRPDLWVDIHSWPHKGDDGMWCTHKWVADGLLEQMPDRTFQDYVWNVSFVKDRKTPDNHLWQWLLRTFDSGGVSLSISWHRRTEQDVRAIGPRLISALDEMIQKCP